MHGRQCRCQEDPVSLPSGRLEKTIRLSPLSTVQQDLKQHHLTLPEAADLAQNRPLWRKDDVNVWHYAILELHARNNDDIWCLKTSHQVLQPKSNRCAFNSRLNGAKFPSECSGAGILLQTHGPATANDLSPSRVLVDSTTYRGVT